MYLYTYIFLNSVIPHIFLVCATKVGAKLWKQKQNCEGDFDFCQDVEKSSQVHINLQRDHTKYIVSLKLHI